MSKQIRLAIAAVEMASKAAAIGLLVSGHYVEAGIALIASWLMFDATCFVEDVIAEEAPTEESP